MSAKKIKFFFKKYLEFEQKHGTEETVRSVKEEAVDYVESKVDTSWWQFNSEALKICDNDDAFLLGLYYRGL